MNEEKQLILIKWVHVGLRTLLWLYASVLVVWTQFTLVGDFGQGLFHVSFWLGIEIFYLLGCALSIGYGLLAVNGHTRVDSERNVTLGMLSLVFTVLVGAKNATHIVFVSIELANQTSAFSQQYYWFLAMFLAMLVVLFLCNIGAFILFWHHRRIMKMHASYSKQMKKYP